LVTREELQTKIWAHDTFVDFDQSLNRAINKVRDVLSDTAGAPRFIETLPRRGYRFIAHVEAAPGPGPAEAAPRQPVSIAVLPFVNSSSDADQEYWSDGLTDELTSALARAGGLRVVSRTSAFAFKGSSIDVREIGRRLGADLVVEGSVRRFGERIRITAQLIKASTGFHLWSETLDRNIEDACRVQQDVVKAIAQAVRLELTPEQRREISERYIVNPQAFELYLKARHSMDRHDFPSQHEAMDLFQHAHAADPSYPLPLVGMAQCHLRWAMVALEPPRRQVVLARKALEQALDLDSQLAEAHAHMGRLISHHEWRWADAEKHHRRALYLAPYSAEVHNAYATEYLALLGRFDEALAENRRARELDCFSPDIALGYPLILLASHRFREAEDEYRSMLAEHPRLAGIRGGVAFALWAQGRYREAVSEFEVLKAAPSAQHYVSVFLASARALCGEREPAQELLKCLELRRASGFVRAMDFVFLHLALREVEKAVAELERAYENQEYALMGAKVSFFFDPLREHPRFQALLGKLGFV
jgi:TolB-like protein/Tfp pilus assembly protein PilF